MEQVLICQELVKVILKLLLNLPELQVHLIRFNNILKTWITNLKEKDPAFLKEKPHNKISK